MDLNKMFANNVRRKLALAILMCAVLLTLVTAPTLEAQINNRSWSDNSGTFSTKAQLLKINSASVTLKKSNQVVIEVPFSRLSQVDLDFVKSEIRRQKQTAPDPVKQFVPSSTLTAETSSRKSENSPGSSSRQSGNRNKTAEAPLRYSATPEKYAPQPPASQPRTYQPQAYADPLMPESIPAIVPTKDNMTSPPGGVARLSPQPRQPNQQFSLGHSRPKKPPIILKSKPQVASTQIAPAEQDPTPKPLLEIETAFKDSDPEAASFETSSNGLRSSKPIKLPETESPSAMNDLRPQSFAFPPIENTPNQPSLGKKNAIGSQDSFQPTNGFLPQPKPSIEKAEIDKFENNNFVPPPQTSTDQVTFKPDPGPIKFGPRNSSQPAHITDPAIVILPNEEPEQPQTKPGITPIEPKQAKKTSDSKGAPFNFDSDSAEAAHVFSQPPQFGPRNTSFEPSTATKDASLTELPPRFQELVGEMNLSKDPIQVRAALNEIQSSWPSQRYDSLVDVVQKCVSAPDVATRILALQTLALRDPSESLEFILKGVEDDSFDVREVAHGIIERMEDPRVIPPLAKLLNSQYRQRVAGTLSKLGPSVETHVIPFTIDSSVDVQLSVCHILANAGTEKSIKALQLLVATSDQARVRLQASNAIDRIKRR